MEVRPWTPARPQAGDLSKAKAFALGPLRVEPSLRIVTAGNRTESLEPRVMRVLVALADASGAVLSRDDLIALCWDGQIVGDNAINRVVSRLRAMLQELAGEQVRLETITKVGFRLIGDSSPPMAVSSGPDLGSLPTSRAAFSRRTAVGGAAAAVALGAIAYIGWRGARPGRRAYPEAVELYRQGVELTKSAVPGNNRQALTVFRRAVAIDPNFADAWGALAIGYTYEEAPNTQQIASAASRALALDPNQPDGRLAAIVGPPFYRRWHLVEPRLRRYVRDLPGHWYGNFLMGWLLRGVGRHKDAIPFARRSVEIDPMNPLSWSALGATLAYSGQSEESDAALDEGVRRWPGHADLWFTRYALFLYSRRFGEAAEFARDSDNSPVPWPPHIPGTYGGLAEALAKNDESGIAAGRAYFRGVLRKDEPGTLEAVPRFAPLLAMTGARGDALSAFEAYLFGGDLFGRKVPSPRADEARFTSGLFSPPMLAQRDARFARLLGRSGLEDYWKRSGSQPDFRRS